MYPRNKARLALATIVAVVAPACIGDRDRGPSPTSSTSTLPPETTLAPTLPPGGTTVFHGRVVHRDGTGVAGVQVSVVTARGLGWGPIIDDAACAATPQPRECSSPGAAVTGEDGAFRAVMPAPVERTRLRSWIVQVAVGDGAVVVLDVGVRDREVRLGDLPTWTGVPQLARRGSQLVVSWPQPPPPALEVFAELDMSPQRRQRAAAAGATLAEVRTGTSVRGVATRLMPRLGAGAHLEVYTASASAP